MQIIRSFTEVVLAFARTHEEWVPLVVFVLAFGESLAFVSLLLPATAILLGAGGFMGAAGVGFWSSWTAAVVGAVLGDLSSYWLGYYYKDRLGRIWPLSRHPGLLPRGRAFFKKWGAAGVFIARFFGPLRSVMSLTAGICEMPQLPFLAVNVASAVIWATAVLAPGTLAVVWFF
jgi:membrane protein DedA with SNARE-associated domain